MIFCTEIRAFVSRTRFLRRTTKAIMKSVAETYYEENLSLFNSSNGKPSAAQFGWDCHELIVRSGTRNSEQENPSSGDWNGKAGHVQIEAKLNTSLDSILRYQAAIKRDLYRAMAALRAMRRD